MASKKIVYIFPDMNFNAWDGPTGIKVSDGRLEFNEPPTDATVLRLIESHGGVLEESKPRKTATKKEQVKEEADHGSN